MPSGHVSSMLAIQSLALRLGCNCSIWMNRPLGDVADVVQTSAGRTLLSRRPWTLSVPMRGQPGTFGSIGTVTTQAGAGTWWAAFSFDWRVRRLSPAVGAWLTPYVI